MTVEVTGHDDRVVILVADMLAEGVVQLRDNGFVAWVIYVDNQHWPGIFLGDSNCCGVTEWQI